MELILISILFTPFRVEFLFIFPVEKSCSYLFFFIGNPICAHAAVPLSEIIWLNEFISERQEDPETFENAVRMLRRKLFPFMHDPHPWVQGTVTVFYTHCN